MNDLNDEINGLEREINQLIVENEKLTKDLLLLDALRMCGVDNWNGYSDALELVEQWENT